MDWDKMPSWDLSTVVGPSSASGGGALDLKLGGPTSWKQAAAAAAPLPPPNPSSSAPAKRARSGQAAQQAVPACSVEGCAADLSKCREYHRRHKVCEAHSKTPVVTVNGQQQRFCQQCSRFHLLGEFDEIKRSCRKRLDGHNRRRRKPQPDPLNPGSLFANHHGVTRFASYPQLFSAPSSMADSKWAAAAIVKTETDAIREHYYPAAAAHLPTNGAAALFSGKDNTNRKPHLPFLTLPHGDGDAGFQPFTITASAPSSESSKQSNGNRALSLLSDNHTLMTVPAAQPLGTAMQYSNGADVSLTGMYYASVGGKQTSSIQATAAGHHTAAAAVTAAHGTQMQYHHGHGYYPTVSGGDGSQSNPDSAAIHQAIPFSSW